MSDKKQSALDIQVGGNHYKNLAIQPMQYCMANGFDYATSNVVKYVTRKKGDKAKRREDLNKAIHCIQLLAEFEGIDLNGSPAPAALTDEELRQKYIFPQTTMSDGAMAADKIKKGAMRG